MGLAALGPAAAAASSSSTTEPAVHGTIKGFATDDFLFLDGLSTKTTNLAQVSVSQSASGVSNRSLQTTDRLGQDLLTTKKTAGHNAYARGAGVSLNLGQGSRTVPQAQLTQAEAVSPPRSTTTTDIVKVPLAPVATADVQPSTAVANTRSQNDFCVLGKPISEGTASVADASVLPVSTATTVLTANGTVRDDSTEELTPNGAGALGLQSAATLNTLGLTLFKGTPAAITIKVINPLVLRAIAGGVKGSSIASYGSNDKTKKVLSITAGGSTTTLTVEQLLGTAGLTIKLDGLLGITIGGKPTFTTSADGTRTTARADLVSIKVLSTTVDGSGATLGGPLMPIVGPVLDPVLKALDSLAKQLSTALKATGITTGADLRIGHFEANAQVPVGGIHCTIPVSKTATPDPVKAGHSFVYTIHITNPYDCPLVDVKVDDTIDTDNGITYTVTGTDPKADSVSDTHVVFDDVGPIAAHGHRDLHITVRVDKDAAAGTFTDHAKVDGVCKGGGTTANGTSTNVSLHGDTTVTTPRVTPVTEAAPVSLPDTGGSSTPALVGSGLVAVAGLGAVTRRRWRRLG